MPKRPPSYCIKPKIDEDKAPPDYLAELLKNKHVSIDMVSKAWMGSMPDMVKLGLAEFLLNGPLDQFWCYDILRIANFSSEGERDTYIRCLLLGAIQPGLDKALQRQHLDQELWRRHCDVVVQHLIDTVRHRILDALFRDANRNRGYGFAVALEHLDSGDTLEQQNALLTILRAFGNAYLADHSFPIIAQRYTEHTRANRKFKKNCDTTLATGYRKKGKTAHDKRRREIIWLALRPALVSSYLNGCYTSTQLKEMLLKTGAKPLENESSKTFAQFVHRNFDDLKSK